LPYPRNAKLREGEDTLSKILPAGTRAPDFRLRVTLDQDLSLSELAGNPVILAFYPADWSPVCGVEVLPEFQKHGAELVGNSVDGAWCHRAFARDRRLHFPLVADFEPKGAVARRYGAYRDAEGVCDRALFVIDRDGVIFWSYLSPIAVNPGADGILDALENSPCEKSLMSTLRVSITSRDSIRGAVDALITLVEYGDYECPHCGAAHPRVLLVQEHFGSRLRFVFRHFPLSQVHPNAETAAQTAEYAGAH
jgi:peroxiredoxin